MLQSLSDREDAIWNISGFSLFFEFFRLNFISDYAAALCCSSHRANPLPLSQQGEGMGYRTVLTVMFDQLKMLGSAPVANPWLCSTLQAITIWFVPRHAQGTPTFC